MSWVSFQRGLLSPNVASQSVNLCSWNGLALLCPSSIFTCSGVTGRASARSAFLALPHLLPTEPQDDTLAAEAPTFGPMDDCKDTILPASESLTANCGCWHKYCSRSASKGNSATQTSSNANCARLKLLPASLITEYKWVKNEPISSEPPTSAWFPWVEMLGSAVSTCSLQASARSSTYLRFSSTSDTMCPKGLLEMWKMFECCFKKESSWWWLSVVFARSKCSGRENNERGCPEQTERRISSKEASV